jgi:asparagine synthase (glutamine-hydrolysing)
MCGFVGTLGSVNGQIWTENAVKGMLHRGPDAQQTSRIAPDLWMGVARLAMTDPHPRANQPFVDQSSGNAISFNGEIYNYRDLRTKLESFGEEFQTDSDTEVLLKFLSTYGVAQVRQLNGMYSFAFYSKSENALYLTRDFLGKKPLYIRQSNGLIQWSSSQDTFRSRGKGNEISDVALTQYLSLGYLLDPVSLQTDVYSVRPGEAIRIDVKNRKLEVLNTVSNLESNSILNSQLRTLMHESVSDRVAGHDKIGVSLSGGVDSSIIAIELSKVKAEVTAYSAVWKDSDKQRYNFDAEAARVISKSLGLNFRPVEMVGSKLVEEELRKFLRAMEEPNNNPSGVSMMKLYEAMAGDGLRLVLTGDGSDEIFGGYQRYFSALKLPNLFKVNCSRVLKPMFADSFQPSRTSALINSQLNSNSPASWLYWHWSLNPQELRRILSSKPTINATYLSISEYVSRLAELPEENVGAKTLMLRDHKIWLAMESNRKLDRISMSHSIEARSPFQDERIINWAAQEMNKTKFKVMGKRALWSAYPEIQSVGTRNDKAGFTSPVGHWLRGNPDLISRSIDILSKDRRFTRSELLKLKDAPNRGHYRELMQLWSLVVLSVWLDLES